WPWLQVVRSAETTPLADNGDPLDEARVAASDLDSSAPFSERPGAGWHKTLLWFNRAVSRVCERGPWLVVLEDLQWADAASLRFLAQLVADAPQLPLLLLLTVRDTEPPLDPGTRRALDYVLGHRECERIMLIRLSTDDVAAYTSQLFGGDCTALAEVVF